MTEQELQKLVGELSAAWGPTKIEFLFLPKVDRWEFPRIRVGAKVPSSNRDETTAYVTMTIHISHLDHRDEDDIVMLIDHELRGFVVHEMEEWFCVRGERVTNPHPPR